MRRSGRWRALVERAQRLWQDSRRSKRTRRVRLMLQACRRCGSRSYLPTSGGRLCGGCRSLQ